MGLVKVSAQSTELGKNTNGELRLEWSEKKNRDPKLFECFRELFENLNDDKVKKFTVSIGGKTYNLDKDSFYTNYKTLQEKVTVNVNKHYPKTPDAPKDCVTAPCSNG
jgi:hypothetical protein